MREILFRGKRIDNGEWVKGFLLKGNRTYIVTVDAINYMVVSLAYMASMQLVEVDSETVGQFTGLTDMDGKEIFEGDILKVKSLWKAEWNNEGVCEKKQTYWSVEHKTHSTKMGFFTYGIDRRWHKPLTWSRLYNAEAEVIGNIHDNPELLEEEE